MKHLFFIAFSVALVDMPPPLRVKAATQAPLFSFASPTRFRGYPAYSGLPGTDGCHAAASVKGTKGEALTFTRATTRFCPTDGTTNEATGVMCASGEVCIRSLSGKRGIDIFRGGVGPGSNSILRSEEFENVAWQAEAIGVAAPTVTADQVQGPDPTQVGTLADRVQFPATGTNQKTMLYQAPGCGPSCNLSVWVLGNNQSGTIDLCILAASGSYACTACNYNSSAFTRCAHGTTTPNGTPYSQIGNNTKDNGGTARPAADVFLWGAMDAQSPYTMPYVKTTSALVTRNSEVATFAGVTVPVVVSMAADVAFGTGWTGQAASYNVILAARTGAADYILLGNSSGFAGVEANPGSKVSRDVVALSAFPRWWAYQTATALGAGHGATAFATTTTSAYTPAPLSVGHWNSTLHIDGLVSNICVDPDPARCR